MKGSIPYLCRQIGVANSDSFFEHFLNLYISPEMATKGKIKQIIGAVVDVHFPDDNTLPEIFNALEITKENGERGLKSKRLDWKLVEGELHNSHVLQSIINKLEKYFKTKSKSSL